MMDLGYKIRKHNIPRRSQLLILASLCFIGVFGGLVGVGLLPKSAFTLAFGLFGLLLVIIYPNFGFLLFLLSLYFDVFPSVTVGPIEFSSSTLLVVGLMIKSFDISAVSKKNDHLAGWQKAVLIALGIVFFLASVFSSSFDLTIRFVPNLVIYLLILFGVMKLVNKPEMLYTITKLTLVFSFILSFWQDILEPFRLFLNIPSLGGVNGMVFAFHPAVAFSLIILITPAGKIFSRMWRFFALLVLASLVFHGVYFETRAAWLAWLIIALLLFVRLPLHSWVRYIPIFFGIMLSVGMLLSGVIARNLNQTEGTLIAVFGTQQSHISSDDLVRLIAQDVGLRMFYARPVFGWGPNTYQFLKPAFVEGGGKEAEKAGAFNSWLAVLAEMGLAGVFAIAVACFLPLIKWANGNIRLKDDGNSAIYWLVYGSVLGVVALSTHAFFITRMFSFFWFYVGLALAAVRLKHDSTYQS